MRARPGHPPAVTRLAFVVAAALLFASGIDGTRAAERGDPSGTTITGKTSDPRESLETAATQLLNDARAQPRNCGAVSFDSAPPLRWNSALAAAAASHSLWMQATDSTDHEQDDGSRAGDRAEAAGYRWQAIAENIAAGQPAIADVVAGWLESPPHCENIMNAEYEEFAIARVAGGQRNRFPTWWTLMLARPQR